jgi:hypothetical protein
MNRCGQRRKEWPGAAAFLPGDCDVLGMKMKLFLPGMAAVVGFAAVTLAADPTRPAGSSAQAAATADVGVGSPDGITMSGGETFVTRNGQTEKLTHDLKLPSGIIVRPDGTVLTLEQTQVALAAGEMLTLDGKLTAVPRSQPSNPAASANPAQGQAAAFAAPASAPSPTAQSPAANGSTSGVNDSPAAGTAPAVTTTGSTNVVIADGASANSRAGLGGSVFLRGDGTPFMGVVTSPGVITTSDGTTVPIDSSIRAVSFGPAGSPPFVGQLNANGTIQASNGSIIFPDGSVRGANGQMLSGSMTGRGVAVSPALLNAAGAAAANGSPNQPGATSQTAAGRQLPRRPATAPATPQPTGTPGIGTPPQQANGTGATATGNFSKGNTVTGHNPTGVRSQSNNGNPGGAVTNGGTGAGGGAPAGGAGGR